MQFAFFCFRSVDGLKISERFASTRHMSQFCFGILPAGTTLRRRNT